MASFSLANFDILADFFEFQALFPNQTSEQDLDLEVFLDVLWEEATDEGREMYDAEMATRDPAKYPWSALHAPEGYAVPVFFLLLTRREDLERDGELAELPEDMASILEVVHWNITHELAKKMATGWRPDVWTPDFEDPYADPYADDLAPLPADPDVVEETGSDPSKMSSPVDNKANDDWIVDVERQMTRERNLIWFGAGIATTTALGLLGIYKILKG